MTQPRTQHADASTWTPFNSATDGQPSTVNTDAAPSANQRTDTDMDATGRTGRSSTGRATDGHPDYLRVIDGGHAAADGPSEDGFDAAAADALAVTTGQDTESPAVPPAPAAAPGPVSDPAPATVETTAPATVETPAQGPAETAPEGDSTPHTPHPDQEDHEGENAAHAGTEAAETPHSTPRWHAFATALNPAGVLFRPQASLAEIVAYADTAPYSANRAVRALEVGWNRAVAVPVSLLLYSAAAAYKRLWRGLGTSAIGVLWIAAVHAAPADTSTVWTWIVLGYWAVSALIVPVIVTKK